VLLVSHDRMFLNNVVTSTIVFEENGAREYFGGYDDWLRQRKASAKSSNDAQVARTATRSVSEGQSADKRRLSFKERQELNGLPAAIEKYDAEIAEIHAQMADPQFYQQPGTQIATAQARLKLLEEQLAAAYQRWEELEHLG